MVVDSLTLLGCQNGIQTGQLELPGGLPESIFKGKICNFLSDSAQDFPGGFPESNFKGKICNFLPDLGQEFPRGSPESNFKAKIGNFTRASPRVPRSEAQVYVYLSFAELEWLLSIWRSA